MPDISVPRDDVSKCFLLASGNNVHATQPARLRRIVQRQINRTTSAFGERLVCPLQSLDAKPVYGYSGLIGVEKYESAGWRVDHLLYKSVPIDWNRGEYLSKQRPIVMVAQDQMKRNAELVKTLQQDLICREFAIIGEVTGNQHERSITVTSIYVGDRKLQSFVLVSTVKAAADGGKMQVG